MEVHIRKEGDLLKVGLNVTPTTRHLNIRRIDSINKVTRRVSGGKRYFVPWEKLLKLLEKHADELGELGEQKKEDDPNIDLQELTKKLDELANCENWHDRTVLANYFMTSLDLYIEKKIKSYHNDHTERLKLVRGAKR